MSSDNRAPHLPDPVRNKAEAKVTTAEFGNTGRKPNHGVSPPHTKRHRTGQNLHGVAIRTLTQGLQSDEQNSKEVKSSSLSFDFFSDRSHQSATGLSLFLCIPVFQKAVHGTKGSCSNGSQ